MTPMSMAPTNVSGRLRILPTTAAANDATSSRVKKAMLSPCWMGASKMPAVAASIVPIIHDTAVEPSVFTPAIDALRGWSTVARIARPSGVNFIRTVAPTAITTAASRTTA